MKYLLIIPLSFCFLFSCSKETFIEPVEEVALEQASLRVNVLAINSTDYTLSHTCEPNSASNTDIGLFYEKNMSIDTDFSYADYVKYTTTGNAVFSNIKPGFYTIIVKNQLGEKLAKETLKIGSNEVIFEFSD